MSSEWRYLSEAKGHLVEIYESLLGMPMERAYRMAVGQQSLEQVRKESAAFDEWLEKKMGVVMAAVEAMESLGPQKMAALIEQWRQPAVDFIGRTPSQRKKVKMPDERTRVLFHCVVLWHMQWALQWLEDRIDEDTLRGGVGYRSMTAMAAMNGVRRVDLSRHAQEMLPEEDCIVGNLKEGDERLQRYRAWTYLLVDVEEF